MSGSLLGSLGMPGLGTSPLTATQAQQLGQLQVPNPIRISDILVSVYSAAVAIEDKLTLIREKLYGVYPQDKKPTTNQGDSLMALSQNIADTNARNIELIKDIERAL